MLLTIGRRCDQSGLVGCDDCCLDDHGLCRRLVTNKFRRHCPTVLFVRYTDNILHSFKQSVSRKFLNKSVTFYKKTHFDMMQDFYIKMGWKHTNFGTLLKANAT